MNRPVGPRLRLSGLIGEARCQLVPHFRVFKARQAWFYSEAERWRRDATRSRFTSDHYARA